MIEEVNTLGPRDVAEEETFDFGVVVCFYGCVRGEGFFGAGDVGVYGREGVSGEDILGFAAPEVIVCDGDVGIAEISLGMAGWRVVGVVEGF